jgi:opacity protein-like surface antigen
MKRLFAVAVMAVSVAVPASAAEPSQGCAASSLNQIIEQLDGDRMKAIVDRLVSFGTRSTLSDTQSTTRGIGAARAWIFDEMSRYAAASGGRMTVAYQRSSQQNARTNNQPVEIVNAVATIRGTTDSNRVYIATGHYDSRNSDVMDAKGDAPGADDDASGVAVIMELARVLSRYPSRATIILGAVAGEEQGLLGAKGLAQEAVAQKWDVEGMITNDIVGGIEGGNGVIDNQTLRIFSANQKGVGESTSRHFARFIRDEARSRLPNVRTRLVYRLDRFGRGGDHRPFFEAGFPAVRFTESNENYKRQHQNVRIENGVEYGDLPRYVAPEYLKLSASVNAVALATAACAPAAPANVKVVGAVTDDTTLTWDLGTDPGLDHYELLVRETTADEWEKVVPIGKLNTYTLRNYPIDNVYFGVRAVDRDGNRSPVRTPEEK